MVMIMSDFSVAKANAESKKRLADMLFKYSQSAIPEGQWTKIKPAQALVKGLESFGGAYLAASGAKDAAKLEDDRRNALVGILKGGGKLTPENMVEFGANPEDIMGMQLKRQFIPQEISSTSNGLAAIDRLTGKLTYVTDPETGKVVKAATADPLLQTMITRGRQGEMGVELTTPTGQTYRAPQKQANPAFGDFAGNAQANAVTPPAQPTQTLKPSNYDDLINTTAAKYGLDPNLIKTVAQIESAFNPTAVSSAGATGLMQLMPATAQRFGVTDRTNPAQSLDGGAQYLKFLSDKYNGDLNKVIAAYNAGEGAVDRYGGTPPYKETQGYVKKFNDLYSPTNLSQQVAQADTVQNDGIVYGQSPADKAAAAAAATLPIDVTKKQAEADIAVQQRANLLPIEQQEKVDAAKVKTQQTIDEKKELNKIDDAVKARGMSESLDNMVHLLYPEGEVIRDERGVSIPPTKNVPILGSGLSDRARMYTFDTLGIQDNEASNTKAIRRYTKQLVMDALGGKLGAGVSNADVEFLQSQQGAIDNAQNIQEVYQAVGEIDNKIKSIRARLGGDTATPAATPAAAATAATATASRPTVDDILKKYGAQ